MPAARAALTPPGQVTLPSKPLHLDKSGFRRPKKKFLQASRLKAYRAALLWFQVYFILLSWKEPSLICHIINILKSLGNSSLPKQKRYQEAIYTASSPGNSVLLIAVLHWSFFFVSMEGNKSPICTQGQSWSQCLNPATSSDTPPAQSCFIFLFPLKEEAENHGYVSLPGFRVSPQECFPSKHFGFVNKQVPTAVVCSTVK